MTISICLKKKDLKLTKVLFCDRMFNVRELGVLLRENLHNAFFSKFTNETISYEAKIPTLNECIRL